MLNELTAIAGGMTSAGFDVPLVHVDLKAVKKADRLWVRLDDRGGVAEVAVMTAEGAGRTWTLRDGQQNSFPAVSAAVKRGKKAASPLRGPLDADAAKLAGDGRADRADRRTALVALLETADLDRDLLAGWPGASYVRRVAARAEALRSLAGGPAAAVPAAHDRFLKAAEDPAALFDRLLAAFRDDLGPAGPGELLDLAAALVLGGSFDAYFDVPASGANGAAFPRLAFDPRNRTEISAALAASADGGGGGGGDGDDGDGGGGGAACAVTGEAVPLSEGKFPQPNLPTLGQTYLFAKNADTPAAARYGVAGTAAFPTGVETAARLQGAALELTEDARRGQTWSPVAGEVPKQWDLLLAFVAGRTDIRVAELVADAAGPADLDPADAQWETEPADPAADGSETTDAPLAEADFTARAARVVAMLGGEEAGTEEPRLSLTVIRQVDPANRKVIHHDLVPLGRLKEAAESWAAAARDAPPVRVRVWSKKRKRPLDGRLWPVAPAALVGLSKSQFIRGGEDRQDVVGGSFADALAAFWGPTGQTPSEGPRAKAARKWLRTLARRHGPLLVRVGGAGRGLADVKPNYVADALKAAAALHVLLARLGRFVPPSDPHVPDSASDHAELPRTYMNDPAFLLGRLLAAADDLHRGYCFDVRGGSVPPLLMGNALMPMAQARPAGAVAALCRRLTPYHGWAVRKKSRELADGRRPPAEAAGGNSSPAAQKKERTRRSIVNSGIWWAFNLKPLALELAGQLSGIKPSDEFRAELLLGYLAGPPDRAKRESPDDAPVPPDPPLSGD